MKICFLCVEIFAWGKYGGFGRATRSIGRELSRRGHEVFAVVPRRQDQKAVEELDGITVHGYPMRDITAIPRLVRRIDAEIYHSQEPSLATYFALQAAPRRKHVVTVRDPRDLNDWRIELREHSLSKLQVLGNYLFENNPLVKGAVRRVDARFAAAPGLIPKVRKIYRLHEDPGFLPTPFRFDNEGEKSPHPTVCFIARFDRRKRPERFFELARRFPQITFLAAGAARDPKRNAALRNTYGALPNLRFLGFIDQFRDPRFHELLTKSWILVNTASREGLPNSFIEALAHRCAILSAVNSDEAASRFGYHVTNGDFAAGLQWLLENDRWRELGSAGHAAFKQSFDMEEAIDRHEAVYRQLLEQPHHR